MAVTFEHRTRSYRACVMMLMLSTLMTLVGYSTSHWVDGGQGQGHYGLWVQCAYSHPRHQFVCVRHDGSMPVDDILQVPQILISLEIAALIICCIITLVINCRRYMPSPRQRYLEVLISLAGLLGSVGCAVFWAHKDRLDTENQVVYMLSWSFFLVFFASVITLVIACAISCNNDVIPGSDEIDLDLTVPSSMEGDNAGEKVFTIVPV